MDRRYLACIAENYGGGPVGAETLAAALAEQRDFTRFLLALDHDELIANGVTGYSFTQFMEDYRVGVLYGWIIPVYAVGTLDSSSERAMALWTEVIKRAQAAMRDHHVADLMK